MHSSPLLFPLWSLLSKNINLDGMIDFLHVVPEDGAIETGGYMYTSFCPTFRFHGTTEQAREQIGTVTIYAEDREGIFAFLDAVATRALDGPAQERTDNIEATTQLAPGDLRQEGADAPLSRTGGLAA